MYRIYFVKSTAAVGKTQKILAKCTAVGARGPKQNRFCNWLGTRGVGGYTINLNL